MKETNENVDLASLNVLSGTGKEFNEIYSIIGFCMEALYNICRDILSHQKIQKRKKLERNLGNEFSRYILFLAAGI